MMLNFDYSSIFDNKEAMHNNSVMSGGHHNNGGLDSGQLSSRYNNQKGGQFIPNMDDSYMSTSSVGAENSNLVASKDPSDLTLLAPSQFKS